MRTQLLRSASFAIFLYLLMPTLATAQDQTDEATVGPERKWIAGGGAAVVMGGALAAFMHSSNYSYDPKFHINRTGVDYLGLDKFMHGQVAYTSASLLHGSLRWAGLTDKKATWWAMGGSFAFMTAKEFLDGHYPVWGWNWSDVGANFAGTALFGAQQLGWGEQRLSLKFSSIAKNYEDPEIEAQVADLFGTGAERLLKDYNRQTYWLSANLNSFGWEGLPAWLNIAVGTGGNNLFGQKENVRTTPNGTVIFDRRDLPRQRQWYLAPDIDLTRIPTNSKFLRTAFLVLNSVKFPLPALELTGGKFKVKAIAF